jgi:DNA-binding MarR family transcriptional regulator
VTREHTANLLGAVALAMTDRMSEIPAPSPTAAAALIMLHRFLDAPTIEGLRQALGLSHSGTVRLVDRLERDGHLRRRPGADARSTALALTPAGRRLATRIATARARILAEAVAPLSDTELRGLDRVLAKVLAGLAEGPRFTCRLCDPRVCDDCPVQGR